ncbi:MAG: PASTA domain-containing protein [Candidatus Krumholzibacteriota bacterium]|nr:PASTA domain-containing protein [Candidatus Krumholzibacteriota bacterium]
MEEKKKKTYHPILFYLSIAVGAFIVGIFIFNYLILPALVGRRDVVIVPDITGMQIEPAEKICGEKGLKMMVSGRRHSDEFPAGTVIEQIPRYGESLKGKRSVRVFVSTGRELEEVPDLVGVSPRQAELTLENACFKKGRVVRIFSHQDGENRVISSSPSSGSLAPVGAEIDILLMMTGEPKVYLMPDLSGKDLLFVKERLERGGFHVTRVVSRRDRDKFPDTILSQTPPAGYSIKEGGTVELVVSTVD